MLKVTVASATLRTINYTNAKGAGKLLVQTAYAHTVGPDGEVPPFPEKFEIVLPKGQEAGYAPGDYTLHPSAVFVDRDGKLACRPLLTQAPAKPANR